MSVGEPRWSILASSAEQVEHFFQETIDNRCVLCSAVYFFFHVSLGSVCHVQQLNALTSMPCELILISFNQVNCQVLSRSGGVVQSLDSITSWIMFHMTWMV